jgi:S-DNA-T family DNA segregation ATPase FtsK/SpoIIIE
MADGRRDRLFPILGIVLICVSILTVLGIRGGPESIGRINVHLGGFLVTYFDILAWSLPVLGLYWGWKLITGTSYLRGALVSAFIVMAFVVLSTFSLVGMGAEASQTGNIGGRIGHHAASSLVYVFGTVGSRIVVIAGLLILFSLATGLSMRKGALRLESTLVGLFRYVVRRLSDRPVKVKPRVSRSGARRGPRRKPTEEPLEGSDRTETLQGPEERPRPEIAIQPKLSLARPEGGARDMYGARPPAGPEDGYRSDGEEEYVEPSIELFDTDQQESHISEEELTDQASFMESKLSNFGIDAKVVEIHPGPVITRFEIEPGSSVKVHQVVNLADDLALALKARSLRILAPIPGKGTIGIEVPNRHPSLVKMGEILASPEFTRSGSKLTLALGKDVQGNPYTADLEAMPHLLIAGATGSGKSVCINTVITSLLYRNSPQDIQILLIDPKRLELNMYEGIPHLICEVVTEPKKAVRALSWVVEEMDTRYKLLAKRGVRNIQSYEEGLPYIVVVIDELADLMLTVPQDIEHAITKLAQMARAVGIHLVMATQRPSVDVITGVIKANFPCRIGFKVASKTDSRTILDTNGAERLLGRGDMLVLPPGQSEPTRIHGAFISSEEIRAMTDFLKTQSHLASPAFTFESLEHHDVSMDDRDELFDQAARIVVTHQQGSVSLLQRRLKVGYSRAARLIDHLEEAGIVGPFEGSKARQVLVDESHLEDMAGTS